jgi:hypothetical protein
VRLDEIVKVRLVSKVRGGDEAKGEKKEWNMKTKEGDHGGKEGPRERKRGVESWLKRLSTNPSEHDTSWRVLPIFRGGPQTPSLLAHAPRMSLSSRM